MRDRCWIELPVAALLASGCAAVPSTPQPGGQEAEQVADSARNAPVRAPWELGLDFVAFPEVDAGPLDVGVTRTAAKLTWNQSLTARTHMSYTLGSERSFYDIGGLGRALPGVDKGHLEVLDVHRFSANLVRVSSPSVSYFAGLGASIAQEPGADLGESTTGNGRLGVRYTVGEDLHLSLGAGVFTRLEEDALVLPFVGLDWRATEAWSVQVGVPATGVTYRATDKLTLALRGRFDFRDYRLDGERELENAIFRDETIAFELGADWKFNDTCTASFAAGIPVDRQISIDDDSGDTLLDVEADKAPYMGLQLRIRL